MHKLYHVSENVTVEVVSDAVIMAVTDPTSREEHHIELSVKQAYELAHALARAGYDIQKGGAV